jgi:hypothetical protein
MIRPCVALFSDVLDQERARFEREPRKAALLIYRANNPLMQFLERSLATRLVSLEQNDEWKQELAALSRERMMTPVDLMQMTPLSSPSKSLYAASVKSKSSFKDKFKFWKK